MNHLCKYTQGNIFLYCSWLLLVKLHQWLSAWDLFGDLFGGRMQILACPHTPNSMQTNAALCSGHIKAWGFGSSCIPRNSLSNYMENAWSLMRQYCIIYTLFHYSSYIAPLHWEYCWVDQIAIQRCLRLGSLRKGFILNRTQHSDHLVWFPAQLFSHFSSPVFLRF